MHIHTLTEALIGRVDGIRSHGGPNGLRGVTAVTKRTIAKS